MQLTGVMILAAFVSKRKNRELVSANDQSKSESFINMELDIDIIVNITNTELVSARIFFPTNLQLCPEA